MDGKCIVCEKNASSKCSRCCSVYYCSKDHQKEHWKMHKHHCKPVQVKEDKTLGRHLVATKDIKEGEIIFTEKPLIIGPAQITPPVCLGCYKVLSEKTSRPCSNCGWPVCDENCEKSPNHKAECEMTVARGQKVNIQTFDCAHPNYQSIIILRCLHLKKSNPTVWNLLMQLESHYEQRKDTEKWKSDSLQVAQFARKFFKLEDQFTEEEITKVCGIVQVNGHEVPFSDPPFVAVYNTTSMLEHNCMANSSKSFTSNGEVLIAAATDLKAGQNVSICYTDPTWGTINRRHHLQETKFFNCYCDRCKDVTELGTMFSALKCQKQDCTGYSLPKTFLFEDDKNSNVDGQEKSYDWYCNQCDKVMSEKSAHKLIEHIGTDLDAMEKGDIESCKKFLDHYGKYLHPSHYYMIDVTLALAHLIGQETNYGLAGVSEENLILKAKICRQISEFLEKLVPGEIRGRGMILFELHATIAETGRRRAEKTGEGPAMLIDYLLDSKKLLEKSLKLLQHEPKEMPEGKIAVQGAKNLVEMDKLLQNLYLAVDSPM